MAQDHLAKLSVGHLLRWKRLSERAKGVVHVQVVDFQWLVDTLDGSKLIKHARPISEISRVQDPTVVLTAHEDHRRPRAVICWEQPDLSSFDLVHSVKFEPDCVGAQV